MPPRFDRFTIKAQEAFQDAQSIAIDRSQQQLDVEHLLAALINQKEGLTTQLFLKLGANAAGISARLEDEIDKLPRVQRRRRGAELLVPKSNIVLKKTVIVAQVYNTASNEKYNHSLNLNELRKKQTEN